MKRICRLSLVMMFFVLVAGLAMPLMASAEMVRKTDNFIIFLDQSGSMAYAKADAGNQKLDQAINAVNRMDQVIPELGYTGAVAMFAPFKSIASSATYKTGSLTAATAKISPPFNHMTPMGDGLLDIGPAIGALSGKTALILFTDGEANQGPDPVAEAKTLYGKYAPNLCIHVVSYADSPTGQQTVDAIRALSGCSVAVDAKTLASEAGMAQFIKDVFYEERMPAPVPKAVVAPAPAPAPAPVAKEVITFNLIFDFDKSNIKDDMVPMLEQAKIILEEDPGTDFVVSGHTDSSGPEAYNQGLSERRAASVKNWLVTNGVSPARLTTQGYGESQPKYDNSTREGRKLNRRVELQTK